MNEQVSIKHRDIEKLNALLARELGRTVDGREGIFRWCWSEDLYWPAFRTGRMVKRKVPATLIGEGHDLDFLGQFAMEDPNDPTVVYVDMVVPEYARVRMSEKLHNRWVVARWFPPEELPNWQHNFPQAGYPADGYRIHTNACLPPFQKPTLNDTEYLIERVKDQRSMSLENRIIDMEADRDREDLAKENLIKDQVADMIPAYGNFAPGKRGNFISFPSTKREIIIATH